MVPVGSTKVLPVLFETIGFIRSIELGLEQMRPVALLQVGMSTRWLWSRAGR